MSSIAGVGKGVTGASQGFIEKTSNVIARIGECARSVFSSILSWSMMAVSVIGVVLVLKFVAANPLTTLVAAILGVVAYKNRQKIALLSTVYSAMFKDFIGLKKHAWFNRVDEHIVLGSIPLHSKDHPQKLQKMNVHGVLSLMSDDESKTEGWFIRPVQPDTWKAMGMEFKQQKTYSDIPLSISQIEEAVEFIYGRAKQGETTYVSCPEGGTRGALVICCYLMKYKNLSAQAALNMLKKARPSVSMQTMQLGRIHEYSDYLTSKSKKP